ncbi:ABC transporter ATP-binding protein [Nocardioides mangrovi]|uniref:ABC transporter ATP-binding protein n=1 Tax=Nocardioides mangrovi TaxID=2874580 RepID=A0ABS7UCR4_9ACTN|nr:ABC transporter ATP-binding protein [Nocardioides mangrovi]MBZ5738432.1 ABC transporter ATP-binding protein [Nocardioides mangrovi]
MLQLDDLSFAYGSVKAVNQVTLEVAEGSIHGLIGPNGAGKSTCIDLVSGRRRPTSGTVRYRGRHITDLSASRRRHLGIARSFQRISVYPTLTVADQLDLAARLVGEQDVDAIVAALDLGQCLSVTPAEIGYGEQRRVDIALALVGAPDLVLLDEPAAGLSREESIALADHLAALVRDRGMTVVLVEHHLEVVYRVCDRLTVLDHGAVIADGVPQEVRRDPQVVAAYLGRSAA